MRPIDKFILHVVHNLVPLNEYSEGIIKRLIDHYKEEADDLNIEINDDQLKKYIERFDVIKSNLIAKGGTDLFKQVGGEKKIEVIVPLSQLIKIVTSSKGAETPESADITPDVVYHNDDDTIIVYNGSKEDNCVRYGRGERWCITRGSYGSYRYSPDRSYPTFYLALNNNLPSSDPLSFVAIQVRNPQTTSENDRYVYTNRANSPHESRPMSFSQLEREVPWLNEIPNAQQILRYIPLSTGEKVNQQYKNTPISIREWVKLPFSTKQQYLVVRKNKTLFVDISNDEFLSKHLPKYPQLAEFVAITPGIFDTAELLKHLGSFSNSDRKSITANIRDKVSPSYLKSDTFPFDVKKLLTKLGKWDLNNDERVYVTSDGNAIVKLKLGDDITLGIYTADDDYPSVKLNKRTSKYLTDYPELDKIPFKSLIKLASDEVIDKSLLDQTVEAAKNDPDSAIIVKDTDNGQIIVDSNSFASYKVDNGQITQIPFDSEEVQAIFDEQTDNEGFQQNVLNLFNAREDIPNQIDRVGLTSILKSMPYTKRILTPNYSNQPVVVLTTDEENPKIFTAYAGPNTQGVTIFRSPIEYGRKNDWRDYDGNVRFTPEMIDSYFDYLRRSNLAFSDESLIRALSSQYDIDTDTKKAILANPNLPLQDTNIYRPAEYQGISYLINTQNPVESKKISDASGKLIKANINPAAAARLLRAQAAQAEPEAEPAAAQAEPAVQGAAAPEAPAGERRRGRPAGVPNTPREAQPRARGNVTVAAAFDERDLLTGFENLPRNDRRRLNVDDAVAVPRAGDRGATARDNQLAGRGQVTNVVSVGPSKIYFITLQNGTRIASINIQPGNRNYVVIGNRAFSLNSPRELVDFLQNRDLLEELRTSLFKVHLQENPHMIDEIKQLKNMKNLKENMSEYISKIYTMLGAGQVGQENIKDFINDNGIDGDELVKYITKYKDSSRKSIIRDIISGKKGEANFEEFKRKFIKKLKKKKLTEETLKNYIRETLKKRLAENQPAPSRETEPGETETIPDRGTEEEEKHRRIGNPNVKPRPKAMNENEQEIIKQIISRYKSKKPINEFGGPIPKADINVEYTGAPLNVNAEKIAQVKERIQKDVDTILRDVFQIPYSRTNVKFIIDSNE